MVYDENTGVYSIYVQEKPDYPNYSNPAANSQDYNRIVGQHGYLTIIGGNGVISDAFNNSTIESIALPNNLKYIAPMAFANCPNLKTLAIPDSVALIGDSLFYNCQNLKEIQFPNSINSIWSQGFSSLKNIEKITLPNDLVSIENNSFKDCTKLTSINMPENLVKIGERAFSGCSSLTIMTIPMSVDTIEAEAFLNCSGLTAIYAHGATPVNLESSPNVFFSSKKSASTCKLYVPAGSKSAYQNAAQWKDFYNIIEMPGFTLSPTMVNISESSGNYPDLVNVTISTAWTAYSNQSWMKVMKDSGNGNSQIAFKTTANPTIHPRSATITVSAAGFASQAITITQAPGAANLSVSTNDISVLNAADSIRAADVISNTDWTVSSDQPWLTVTPASGSGLRRLTFITTDMPSENSRTAKVTVSSPGLESQTINVTQAISAAKLAVSTNEISISNVFECTQTADIISNTKWTASSDQFWLIVNSSSGSGSGKLAFNVDAMPTISTRTAKIIISSPGLTPQIVKVTQQAGEASFKLAASSEGVFTFGMATLNMTSVLVDWGDGELVASNVGPYWTEITSSKDLKANSTLSIYGKDVIALDLREKKLTGIDVSNLKDLWVLACYGNKLTSLDVSKNTLLTILYCDNNKLTSLDVSKNLELAELSFIGNQINSINVNQNVKLTSLVCWYNRLTTLDISKNPELKKLDCSYNQLTSLEVSTNSLLSELNCEGNSIPIGQLPQVKSQYTKFIYSPQSTFPIPNSIVKGIPLDLSCHLKAKDINGTIVMTTFKWKTTTGNTLFEGTDYNVSAPGKFVFLNIPDAPVYCEMSNAAFPDFKDNKIYKTTSARISLTTGIANPDRSAEMQIYASAQTIYVRIPEIQLNSRISIFDMTGRLIISKLANNVLTMIQVNGSGVYVVRVNNGKSNHTAKVIVNELY